MRVGMAAHFILSTAKLIAFRFHHAILRSPVGKVNRGAGTARGEKQKPAGSPCPAPWPTSGARLAGKPR